MRHALACLLLLAAAAPAAHAAEIGYNLVEVGAVVVDGVSSGPTAKVAAELGAGGLYGSLGITRQSLRGGGRSEAIAVGLGHALALGEGLDLNTEAGVQHTRTDGLASDAYRVSLGLTRAPSPAWVLSAKANLYFGGDLDAAASSVSTGVEYYLSPAWSVAVEAEWAAGPDAVLLALHWGF